ncbi:MAG: GGDEF domain-containing protein [Polyangia bacterium]
MALLDPRFIEIDILSAADRETFSGGKAYEYRRTGTLSQEDRQREEALLELMTARAIVSTRDYGTQGNPDLLLERAATAAIYQLFAPSVTVIPLKITHAGRLRLFRLRDELLSGRDRIRDEFNVLWAHRHWLPDLTVRLRSRDPGTPISILLLDVDRLKQLNSELGNPGADKVLAGVFEELRDAVRPHEGYRLGGDEAGAIMVGVSLDEANKTAEEIRRRVEGRAWPTDLNMRTRPTVSIGVGANTADIDAEPFYQAVDRVRARAKESRNLVVGAAVPGAE